MVRVPQVMVIDPDRESANELGKMLTTIGLAPAATASYGVEAFTLAHQLHPDAILLRIEEPLARPLQTLARLSDALPDVPVIAYSPDANNRVMRQAMMSGASDYLQEPFGTDELENSVLRVLERKEREILRRRGELDAPVPHGTIITVFGAKGGIGKTTIAANLAVALATEGNQTVALVDMDTRFGDVAITLDIPVERSIADLARDLDTLNRGSLMDYLVEHESGVHVLPAPTRPSEWRNMTARHVRDVVDILAQTHDFVILDTPGTFNEIVAAAIEVGTMILLMTTLDMASIKDTVLALEMLSERFGNDAERIKVVLNRAGMDTGVREADVERTLDAPIWWRIPQDNEVMKAAQLGRPIVLTRPNSRVSREIREMARGLAGIRSPRVADTRRRASRQPGFLTRFVPFLRKTA